MCVEIKWQNTFSGSTNVIFTRRQMTGKNILVTSAAHQKSLISSAAKSIDPDRKPVGEEAENEDDEQSANEDGKTIQTI